ncbi:hypothetical protein CERZMDRAFT_106177 [Cercospora zeae-maydis SCOH1-5]|uniref:BAG domain-containing protein n=1 Tax=Cercospora zeae-maydis SCOH1-5 TaxID=717836 RepID=A0A6A6FG65_9PEZI|nr:hypothetical protein CERZMDRAFT_106177 [Cercospora zeae-maydis SCOH1-5]
MGDLSNVCRERRRHEAQRRQLGTFGSSLSQGSRKTVGAHYVTQSLIAHHTLPPHLRPRLPLALGTTSAIVASSSVLENVYNSIIHTNLSRLLPLHANLSATVEQATKAVEGLLGISFGSHVLPEEPSTTYERLSAAFLDFVAGRTALENTSIFLAFTTFLFLIMSWAQRFGGTLGRFSPFTRSPPQGPTKVSDADFSYITADDLRKHQAESVAQQQTEADLGPPRDTDVLILRNKKKEHPVHFPAYSIAKGELTVGKVRDQVAKVMQSDARRIKLLYKGKNLKDDSRACNQEGLKDGAELLFTVAEGISSPSDSEDSDGDLAGINGSGAADGEGKRKRNRGKKTKRRNKRDQSGTSTPQEPPLGVPNGQQNSRAPSPRPPPSPATPLDKLHGLHLKLQEFVPACEEFLVSPPSDPAKKDFEHKRLTETILTQVLLKTDGVETEGDEEARARRKALVKETQSWLNKLDAARN